MRNLKIGRSQFIHSTQIPVILASKKRKNGIHNKEEVIMYNDERNLYHYTYRKDGAEPTFGETLHPSGGLSRR